MGEWTDGWILGRVDRWTERWIDGQVDGQLGG